MKALLFGPLLLLHACIASVTPPAQYVNHVEIDSAFASFFADARDTQQTEFVLCLYGAVRNDTAWLNFIKPARMLARTEHLVVYDACPRPESPTLIAQFLGTWHGHKVDSWDGCAFSDIDSRSFVEDRHAVLELMSCKGKLMARSKKK